MSSHSDPNVLGDDYFNNDDHHAQSRHSDSGGSPGQKSNGEGQPPNGDGVPKLKRTACVLCRKRKLKCDGTKPKCATCARLGHRCEYDHIRKKSGPKRGYVRDLERRLQDLERTLTQNQSGSFGAKQDATSDFGRAINSNGSAFYGTVADVNSNQVIPDLQSLGSIPDIVQPPGDALDDSFSWEMISLGLEEPMPDASVVRELEDIYFEKVHMSAPIIHRARYRAAMDLAPHMRPPISLRYAMWTLAAGLTDKYASLTDHFYRRARKYLELDEMRGHGENIITLSHCQAWVLLVVHEFKCMYFPRAWMSTGRAVRLAQMLGLHRLDGVGLDVKQCLPVPRDWTEREERRRTYWMAFWEDRCASIGTGWPMSLDESDILTDLPASEEAYQNSRQERTISLQEALEGNCAEISSFAGTVLLSALFGRNLLHLHRPDQDDRDDDLNGKFWQRHRAINDTLSRISLALPDRLKIPLGLPDPNVIFLNMCIHTSIICLHQAAIFKADKNRMDSHIAGDSKVYCIKAAMDIAHIMRCVSLYDLSAMNPFTAFCLYVSARVFVQYLKARRDDQHIYSSLTFIFSAMHRIKQKNPLTESFLAQLEVDMESSNMPVPRVPNVPETAREQHLPDWMRGKDHACGTALGGGVSEYNVVPATGYREPENYRESLPDRSRKSRSPNGMPAFPNMSRPQQYGGTPTDDTMDVSPNPSAEEYITGVPSSTHSQGGNPFTPPDSEANDIPQGRTGTLPSGDNWRKPVEASATDGVEGFFISNMGTSGGMSEFLSTSGIDVFPQMDNSSWPIGTTGMTPMDDGFLDMMGAGLNWGNTPDSRTQEQWTAPVGRQA